MTIWFHSLQQLGIRPCTYESIPRDRSFANVVFSAPPSTSEDYPGDLRRALDRWDGSGAFVFTSSAALYDVHHGEGATEVSPIVPLGVSVRTDRLLQAEIEVVDAGGTVLRLVGLYHSRRGAHTYYLRKAGESVNRWGGAVINLVHYEDAAGLTLRLLRQQHPGHIFVGVDDEPITLDVRRVYNSPNGGDHRLQVLSKCCRGDSEKSHDSSFSCRSLPAAGADGAYACQSCVQIVSRGGNSGSIRGLARGRGGQEDGQPHHKSGAGMGSQVPELSTVYTRRVTRLVLGTIKSTIAF